MFGACVGVLALCRNVSEQDQAWYRCEASTQQEALRSPPALLLLAGNTLPLDNMDQYLIELSLGSIPDRAIIRINT